MIGVAVFLGLLALILINVPIAVAICAVPNLIAVLSLSGVFMALMGDYLSERNRYATRVIDLSKDYVQKPG